VGDIVYYIGERRLSPGGQSFPPVMYHHIDDYPLRNSVLVGHTGRDETGVPSASGWTVAHELGHMLLNTGDHWGGAGNLMTSGNTLLTSDQCDRMHENRERLFGDDAVPDPGPPTTGATAIAMVSGSDQVGKAGESLEMPFSVQVTDTAGEAVRHVHVYWSITSGAGHFPVPGGQASWTGTDGIATMGFLPTALGTSTVSAAAAGLEGSPVSFTTEATILVIRLGRRFNPWTGFEGDPVFIGPEGGSDVTVPVGTPVEWSVIGGVEAGRIASTSEPPGGEPFDSGLLNQGERFQFVPDVAGTWEYEDRVSGATGTLTAH
jgi:hypothetical protein